MSLQVTSGMPATFSAVALRAVSYQWRKNGVALPGATSSIYSIATTALGDEGTYDLVATNPKASVLSREATLTVGPASFAPVITVQSGDTFQKQGTLTVINSAGFATGSTVSYYYAPAGADRLPTIYQLDVGSEATYPIAGVELGLKGEIFNLTDTQRQIQASTAGWCNDASSTSAACQSARASYGKGTSRNAYQAPRSYRLTALVRF